MHKSVQEFTRAVGYAGYSLYLHCLVGTSHYAEDCCWEGGEEGEEVEAKV